MTRQPQEPGPDRHSASDDKYKARKQRHIQKQIELGYTRINVKCHVEDVAKIRAYAAKLLDKRASTT